MKGINKKIKIKYGLYFALLCASFYGCKPSNDLNCNINIVYEIYEPVYQSISELAQEIRFSEAKDITMEGKIYVYKDYVFVNRPKEGFHIINTSDISNPENMGFINVPGSIDIAIKNDIAYVDIYSGLVSIDIADIRNPQVRLDEIQEDVFDHFNINVDFGVLNQFQNSVSIKDIKPGDTIKLADYRTYNSNKVFSHWQLVRTERGVIDACQDVNSLYFYIDENGNVAFYNDAIVYDTFNTAVDAAAAPTNATRGAESGVGQAGSLARFLVLDNYLYVLNSWQIRLFNIDASSGKLSKWNILNTNNAIETIFAFNNHIFIGSTTGMLIYNIDDVGNPKYVSELQHFRSCDPVVADSEYAYVTLRAGNAWCGPNNSELQIVDIKDIQNPTLISNYALFGPYGLALNTGGSYCKGNLLFVCDGEAGVKIFDVSDKMNPKVIHTIPDVFAYDVILNYPRAIIVTSTGLIFYKYGNPLCNPEKVREYKY